MSGGGGLFSIKVFFLGFLRLVYACATFYFYKFARFKNAMEGQHVSLSLLSKWVWVDMQTDLRL